MLLMIPECDNVCGIISAPHGLEPVQRAVEHVVAGGRVYIYRSGFNGAETLHLRSDSADFDSDYMDDDRHLFSGGVAGSLDDVLTFVQKLSESLSQAGIEHSFEVYDGKELVQRIPE